MRYNVLHLVGFSAFLLSDVSSKRAGRLLCFSPCRPWAENSAPPQAAVDVWWMDPTQSGAQAALLPVSEAGPSPGFARQALLQQGGLGGPLGPQENPPPSWKKVQDTTRLQCATSRNPQIDHFIISH